MSIVVVAVPGALPSETLHSKVRVGLALKSVGLSLVEWNATCCSTVW